MVERRSEGRIAVAVASQDAILASTTLPLTKPAKPEKEEGAAKQKEKKEEVRRYSSDCWSCDRKSPRLPPLQCSCDRH